MISTLFFLGWNSRYSEKNADLKLLLQGVKNKSKLAASAKKKFD